MKQRWTFRAHLTEEQSIPVGANIWLRPVCLELGPGVRRDGLVAASTQDWLLKPMRG